MTCEHGQSVLPPGRKSAEICPDELELTSGLVDDRRATLTREHPLFPLFEFAWRQQSCWSLDEHFAFWRGALDLWPARRGRRSVTGRLGWAALRAGSIEATAAALGRAPDDLRRELERAEEHPTSEAVVTDYVLPRVYAGHEPAAHSCAYPNYDGPLRPPDAVTTQMHAALEPIRGALAQPGELVGRDVEELPPTPSLPTCSMCGETLNERWERWVWLTGSVAPVCGTCACGPPSRG